VQLFLAHVLVWGKSKDTIGVFTKTLRFVESQELEVGTLIVLQLHFKFSQFGGGALEWLDACIVLPDKSLKFG
jgi:hypothetical protein